MSKYCNGIVTGFVNAMDFVLWYYDFIVDQIFVIDTNKTNELKKLVTQICFVIPYSYDKNLLLPNSSLLPKSNAESLLQTSLILFMFFCSKRKNAGHCGKRKTEQN